MDMSEDILAIKHKVISSQAFKLNNDILKSEKKLDEAEQLTFELGYNVAYMEDEYVSMPVTLSPFSSLKKSWDKGVLTSLEYIEMSECMQCQDNEVAMCSRHDC